MTAHSNLYPTKALQEMDAAHHWHPFSDMKALNAEGSRIITQANGVWLTDSDGKTILDAMAGLWCVQVGHGRREIADAVHKQMSELAYYNTFFKTTHPPAIALSEKLAGLAPAHINKVFYCSSGSEANDTIFRMVRTYWDKMGQPDKKVIIGRWNGYHGSTLAGASLGGMKAMHAQGDLPVSGVHHIDQPYWFGEGQEMDPETFGRHAARKLEDAIDALGEDKVAAFIAEPIQGAGGVIIPPASYWPEIRRILSERDILFVSDEVICGFGRLGEWFGSTHYGMEPDLMPIAKGLTSGYLPMGGVLVSDRVAEGLMLAGDDFNHGYTYSGHPACAAAALANLEIIEREGLVDRVKNDIGPYLQERWLKLADHDLVGEARMTGLMGALELVPDKANRQKPFKDVGVPGLLCRDISFEHGMVMRAVRDTMIISPPLVLSHAEADHLVETAERTLNDTFRILERDGWLVV